MADTVIDAPDAPNVPMGYFERMRTIRQFHTGFERFRERGGPVTMVRLGPSRFVPTFAAVTSPQGAHDVLGGSDGSFDKEMIVHVENRALGTNLFNLAHESWKPRRRTIQPAFTKRHVDGYAGHMGEVAAVSAADMLSAETVDVDPAMRTVLGLLSIPPDYFVQIRCKARLR